MADEKKVKKDKKRAREAEEPAAAAGEASPEAAAAKPKKAKKDTDQPAKEKKKKKDKEPAAGAAATEEPKGAEPALNPLSLDNFQLSAPIIAKLRACGVNALFDIQAQTCAPAHSHRPAAAQPPPTARPPPSRRPAAAQPPPGRLPQRGSLLSPRSFAHVMGGLDVVGRARTGQGKTLAFVLPILESLARAPPRPGRAPSVVVLAPTRELAKQVHEDFEKYGAVLRLQTVCVYGGAPMGAQEAALRRGVDVVVGTPGRVKDFVERGTLDMSALKFRVLDEADEMLNMGFVEDVEVRAMHAPLAPALTPFCAVHSQSRRGRGRRSCRRRRRPRGLPDDALQRHAAQVGGGGCAALPQTRPGDGRPGGQQHHESLRRGAPPAHQLQLAGADSHHRRHGARARAGGPDAARARHRLHGDEEGCAGGVGAPAGQPIQRVRRARAARRHPAGCAREDAG